MAGRTKKNIIGLGGDKKIAIYATPRLSAALDEVTEDMTLIKGVRFLQLVEAAYEQGRKDGARNVFDTMHGSLKAAEKAIPHRNPGKPKKR